ncbi:MAG: hypothetical protein KDK39_18520, partial [Leptospiraceae bacterium]|nr:hypothetical protein [Leptospiraceae bacterium]
SLYRDALIQDHRQLDTRFLASDPAGAVWERVLENCADDPMRAREWFPVHYLLALWPQNLRPWDEREWRWMQQESERLQHSLTYSDKRFFDRIHAVLAFYLAALHEQAAHNPLADSPSPEFYLAALADLEPELARELGAD